jgi:hypothetical protein
MSLRTLASPETMTLTNRISLSGASCITQVVMGRGSIIMLLWHVICYVGIKSWTNGNDWMKTSTNSIGRISLKSVNSFSSYCMCKYGHQWWWGSHLDGVIRLAKGLNITVASEVSVATMECNHRGNNVMESLLMRPILREMASLWSSSWLWTSSLSYYRK